MQSISETVKGRKEKVKFRECKEKREIKKRVRDFKSNKN